MGCFVRMRSRTSERCNDFIRQLSHGNLRHGLKAARTAFFATPLPCLEGSNIGRTRVLDHLVEFPARRLLFLGRDFV